MSPSVTGFPESLDGRVKTLHPGVHAGLLADLRLEDHERQLAELRHRPVRAGRGEPLPVRRDRRLGCRGRRRRRADRHRRPRDGARVREELRQRRDRRLARVVPGDHRGARAPAARRSPQRRELAARAFAHTARVRPRGRDLVRRGRRLGDDGDLPAAPHDQGRAPRRRCATARTRTSAPRSTRAPAATASRRRRSCRARRCRTTTTSTPMPPCAPRSTWSSRPSRSSSTRTPAASRSRRRTRSTRSRAPTCARTSATRCRRSAASSRPTAP